MWEFKVSLTPEIMKIIDPDSMAPSCKHIQNTQLDHRNIYTAVSMKISHKICLVNSNESPVGSLLFANH